MGNRNSKGRLEKKKDKKLPLTSESPRGRRWQTATKPTYGPPYSPTSGDTLSPHPATYTTSIIPTHTCTASRHTLPPDPDTHFHQNRTQTTTTSGDTLPPYPHRHFHRIQTYTSTISGHPLPLLSPHPATYFYHIRLPSSTTSGPSHST